MNQEMGDCEKFVRGGLTRAATFAFASSGWGPVAAIAAEKTVELVGDYSPLVKGAKIIDQALKR